MIKTKAAGPEGTGGSCETTLIHPSVYRSPVKEECIVLLDRHVDILLAVSFEVNAYTIKSIA